MAQAGFYLAGSDRVACYLCSVVINNWKDGQDPLQRHREEFVECPLVIALSKNGRKTTAELRVARYKYTFIHAKFYSFSFLTFYTRRATFGKWWPHKDKPLRLLPSKVPLFYQWSLTLL